MCYRPLKLSNLSKERTGGNDYIKCACRKCDECHSIASSDYVTRSVVMYDKLVGNGYDAFFVTFTFNPESLPMHPLYTRVCVDDGVSSYSWSEGDLVPTFDHDLLKRFKNSLNKYFNRLGLPKIHFLFTCEYGSENMRPHYHANLFLPSLSTFPYSEYTKLVNAACERFNASEGKHYNSVTIPPFKVVQHLLLNYWKYGFIKNEMYKHYLTDDGRTERSVFSAIRYITKYASKYCTNVPCYVSSPSDYALDIMPHRYVPRVFTSDGYGEPLHHLSDDCYIKGEFKKFFDGQWRNLKIPQYYIYKHYSTFHLLENPHVVLVRHCHEPYFMSEDYRKRVVAVASRLDLRLPDGATSLEECRLLVRSVLRVDHSKEYFLLRAKRFENSLNDFERFLQSVVVSPHSSPLRRLFTSRFPVQFIRHTLDGWAYYEDFEYWIFAGTTPRLLHTELWYMFEFYQDLKAKERELAAERKRESDDLFYKSHQKVKEC